MKLSRLASKQNLELAWRRIVTGGNNQYKRFYRPLYYAYEVALNVNLRNLRRRLLDGTFVARHPERIYVPKSSGLHRPLALLSIEDQIVLQAFANLAAKRLQEKRADLQFKVVFSNILEKPDSIFFFRRWQDTYRAFQKRVERHYMNGMHWVGDFDLAAFYDTISHELLLRTIYPSTKNNDLEWVARCLRTWSSDRASSGHGHGLPQGPLASSFLAECFLLPIDFALQEQRGYTRYVDDIRLFGESENEVRANLIELESHCRERGLIPQTGKFAIKRAHSVREAMGMLPSISDPHHEGAEAEPIGQKEALHVFYSAINGKPYRVTDKTRLRYTLFRAGPDRKLLELVLRLIPRHPEHADVFFIYLGLFGYRKPVEKLCLQLVTENPYPYVRGEAWHILAKCCQEPQSITASNLASLTARATDIARQKAKETFVERWGACHFLCIADKVKKTYHSKLLKHQTPLLQSLLAPVIPDNALTKKAFVAAYISRTEPEPGLSICPALHKHGLKPTTFGFKVNQFPLQVANALRELGLMSSPRTRIDSISEILQGRYRVSTDKSWHKLLGAEYLHALGLLKQAEATFDMGRSIWLICQNSFNQTIFLALQQYLQTIGHPAACRTIDTNGQLINFGVTLDTNGRFSRNCPRIANCFREMNRRRNCLPESHPYEKKTATQSRYLRTRERNRMATNLQGAYIDFVALMPI